VYTKFSISKNYSARVITNNIDYINVRGINLVKSLGWMTVQQRFEYFRLILIYKCIHGLAPLYLQNEINMQIEISSKITRTHDMNLHLSFPKNEFYKNKLMYGGAKSWNDLPGDLKDITSLNMFKFQLKKYIKGC